MTLRTQNEPVPEGTRLGGGDSVQAVTRTAPDDNTPLRLIQVPVHTCDAFDCEECRTAPLWRFRDAEGADIEVTEDGPACQTCGLAIAPEARLHCATCST